MRNKTALSLIMIDIDYFKAFNDKYGHLGGDDCLKQVATAMLASLRTSDFAARYGGEEFVCILHETDAAGTLITAERIRAKIELLHIPHGASQVSPFVTASLGAVSLIPTEDFVPDNLIKLADQMMYKAKDMGRNRVEPPH